MRVASGEALPCTQEELKFSGHAIELRVYAEDPANQFLPDIGKLSVYREPDGEGVRVDSGYEQGMEVPIYYDPMLSKLIAGGRSRAEAIDRLRQAIDEYKIEGVKTTLPFGRFVLDHPAFQSGQFDTGFVSKYWTGETELAVEDEVLGAVARRIWEQEVSKVKV